MRTTPSCTTSVVTRRLHSHSECGQSDRVPLHFREVVDHPLFSAEPFRWRMGTRSLVVKQWLQSDDRRAADLAEKDRLTEQHRGLTFVSQPGSEAAGTEVFDLVCEELTRDGHSPRRERAHPLENSGLSVQEDLCLMEATELGWVLTAGSVCFPTRWDLPSKLGRSLTQIHSPVPGYEEQLGRRVERFFDRMAAGSLAYRLNWSLVGDSARRLDATRQAPMTMPCDPGEDLFLRVERQTLRRLKHHDAMVFGIRIHVWSLAEVVQECSPDLLANELETMPVDVVRYKNLDGMSADLVAWLRRSEPRSRG
jgi:dimethylamine monooxygenase subunit A